jgi:ubiquitin C-terminal hydrolase
MCSFFFPVLLCLRVMVDSFVGRLANAFADLIKELWIAPMDNHSSSSWLGQNDGHGIKNNVSSSTRRTSSYTIPSQLKRAVATYAPRFAGCAQHDTQEFLAYLLDGLHEDLNRVRGKKTYVNTPDHIDDEYVDDDSRLHLIDGAQSWDAYQKRNSSVLIDSFYGQFKSTCMCPLCERVSVSFGEFHFAPRSLILHWQTPSFL